MSTLDKKNLPLYNLRCRNTRFKMDQIIKVAWELNESTDNRYKLVYEIAELAKKLVDEP